MTLGVFLQIPLLGALWGLSFVLLRATAPVLGAFVVAEGRILVALIIYVILLRMRANADKPPARIVDYITLGVIGLVLPFVLAGLAAKEISASLLALTNATVPFFAAIYAKLFLKDSIGLRRLIGMPIAFAGVVLIAASFGEMRSSLFGLLIALLSSAFYASGAIYVKARMSTTDTADLAMWPSLCSAILLIIPAANEFALSNLSPAIVGLVCLLGACSTALPLFLYYRLVKVAGPLNATFVSFFIPLFGVIWASLLLGERLTPMQMLGGLLIIVSIASATNVLDRLTFAIKTFSKWLGRIGQPSER
ncbi:DMT family transporter [Bradyrhizobium prioriisuperbiae]|uniref:DMT family transporter n=1 Tax=Bradyrhizobium prioriisuperbiae TaxID=2854389 RepID=UPI0028E43610|nr:DMT family transporter [Bradyrhizobium prioritasuperba]